MCYTSPRNIISIRIIIITNAVFDVIINFQNFFSSKIYSIIKIPIGDIITEIFFEKNT